MALVKSMASKIHSGDLKFRVAFKAPEETVNSEGGRELAYPDTTIETWSAIKDVRQYRTSEGEAVSLIGIKEFFIRWTEEREAIGKDWLLVYRGDEYTIHEAANLNNEKVFIRIVARKKE